MITARYCFTGLADMLLIDAMMKLVYLPRWNNVYLEAMPIVLEVYHLKTEN